MKKRLLSLAVTAALCVCITGAAAESPVSLDQRRGPEQTFLTFPEWYLVHSPAEYATFVANHPPSEFPFVSHVGQLWSSYAQITQEQLRHNLPLNPGYHVMILVISTSTTVEYLIRSVYENTFGRISYELGGEQLTEEDLYGAKVAQDYVDFIRKEPWYLYNFTSKLKNLWISVPLTGSGFIRKIERRFALTTEYLVKALYALVIEKATRATYTPALMTTQVVLDRAPKLPEDDNSVHIVKVLPDGHVVADLPRYFDFRIAATMLARQGVNLIDVAGNTSDILVSAWAHDDKPLNLNKARVLFRQPIITHPGWGRVALVMPVGELSQFLVRAPEEGLEVEHVYDY